MTETQALPVRLGVVPLFEATFDLRFRPSQPAVADLLPGILFAALRDEYQRSQATPLAGLPPQIRAGDANLRYQAQYRLVGETGLVFIGDEVVGLSQGPPYEGWDRLLPRIKRLLSVVAEAGLVESVQRYSLKFDNLLDAPPGERLALLDFRVELAGGSVQEPGTQFRTEIRDGGLVRIIRIVPSTGVKTRTGATKEGLLLSLDVINMDPQPTFLETPDGGLESIHTELKRLFFSIINDSTLETLKPEYP